MKNYLLPSLKLTAVLIMICSVLYPLLIAGIGILAPGNGKGITVHANGLKVGYENIGQKFTEDKYFQGRPSSVDYNAAGSCGSNKSAGNPEYLDVVKARIDTFLVHNPTIKKADIPSDIVTASGSGLDPDISVEAAMIQVPRISKIRNRNESEIYKLVKSQIEKPLFGIFGTTKINVLKLNIALNTL